MSTTVSEQLLDLLIKAGVQQVFGVIGDALNPFAQAIHRREGVDWVGVRFEGNGSYAAFAQAELSGHLAVCAGTVGPGALHLINGLYNAKRERCPVIAVTGQVPLSQLGTNFHQEVDLEKVFADVCGYQAIIRSAAEAPRLIQRAIKVALSERTVCRIELPADIAAMPASGDQFIHPLVQSQAQLTPSDAQVRDVAAMIREHEKIAILAGAGCRDCRDQVIQLAERLQAPITHSLRACDVFDHDCPHVAGLTGLIGIPSGYHAVMDCDLLIMLGTDFPYTGFLPHKTKTIQVDTRLPNIGNRTAVSLGIHGDIGATLEKLLPIVDPRPTNRFHDAICKNFRSWRQSAKENASPSRDHEPLHPQIFLSMIDQHAADDAIFVVDTGTATVWAARHVSFHSDRRMIGSFNHGSMAVGVPGALGAQMLFPDREVWAIVGDGAFTMAMQDWLTIVSHQLPVKLLVLHNNSLAFVKLEMEVAGIVPEDDVLGVDVPDLAAYSRWCGGDGIRVEHACDIEAAIQQAKAADGPFVIDAVVSSGELMMPPKIGMDQVTGMAASKIKQTMMAISGDQKQWDMMTEELTSYFDTSR
ncbi:thiamine pyrophosphate-dependent enzyme [Rhodopirellula sp. MGV]|uniref:thiamine pyrophosphate-dependent enzyme n=1 Tax=Rhodopirellula sp. MGV TaxID=2023130 RepID=UPI000B96431B|nr:thiamine pyrophosphate-dependent enzyme [Rhodopirellula sp. MGV]OYP32975.1 hypothetical protein CGZ80_18930 [Rhodopirellula sp. MGV]PNY35368.1 hypothetical protein C2E31_17780 [Rhodopirellula baltica]